MQAVINISQEGTRLRPLSCTRCVGMIPIGDMPLVGRLIHNLKESGVEDIVIITGYMPDNIKDYLRDGEALGVKIQYVSSENGDTALKTHSDILEEEFLYFSHVVYTEIDFKEAIEFHRKNNAYVTVFSRKGAMGDLVYSDEGRVTRLEEKRLWHSVSGEERGTGIYILSRDTVRFIPSDVKIDIFENVLPSLVRSGKSVFCREMSEVCESIHDFASLMRAGFAFLDSLKKTAPKGIMIEEGAIVEKGALLEAPCYIGRDAHIHKGAKVGAYTTIGQGSVVKEKASIKRSLIGGGCRIGKGAELRGCVIDAGATLGENVTVFEQGVIGYGTKIGNNVKVKSFVKIWPEKSIEDGVSVSENIMWGQKKRTKIYNKGVIRGVINADITPKFCAALGTVAGVAFDMGEVGISTDGSAASLMIRDGIVSGLMGTGAKVKDFGEQPLPITRRGVTFYMLRGGIDISVSESGGEDVAEITVIDNNGADIPDSMKNRLEDYFEKGDFAYPEGKNIKECEYVFEYKIYYLKSLVGYEKKKSSLKRILLSCFAPWGRRLVASAMADFEASVSIYNPPVDDDYSKKLAFSEAVKLGGFDIGFIMDEKCEKLTIALPGSIIDEETYEALASLIVMKKHKNATIYVPVTASSVIDYLAGEHNCDLVRTKSTPFEIMRHVTGEEEYLTDQFIFRFDAVGSVIKLIDFLAGGEDIHSLLAEIPPITMAKTVIEIPKEEIDAAIGHIKNIEGALSDGESVKITLDKGWVVVVPDAKREVCRVVSESVNAEFARELCDFCVDEMLK